MTTFECNEGEGLACIASLSKLDESSRWEDKEKNGGVDLFVGGDVSHGGGFYCQFYQEEGVGTRCRITYSSSSRLFEESIKALLEEAVKTPIVSRY